MSERARKFERKAWLTAEAIRAVCALAVQLGDPDITERLNSVLCALNDWHEYCESQYLPEQARFEEADRRLERALADDTEEDGPHAAPPINPISPEDDEEPYGHSGEVSDDSNTDAHSPPRSFAVRNVGLGLCMRPLSRHPSPPAMFAGGNEHRPRDAAPATRRSPTRGSLEELTNTETIRQQPSTEISNSVPFASNVTEFDTAEQGAALSRTPSPATHNGPSSLVFVPVPVYNFVFPDAPGPSSAPSRQAAEPASHSATTFEHARQTPEARFDAIESRPSRYDSPRAVAPIYVDDVDEANKATNEATNEEATEETADEASEEPEEEDKDGEMDENNRIDVEPEDHGADDIKREPSDGPDNGGFDGGSGGSTHDRTHTDASSSTHGDSRGQSPEANDRAPNNATDSGYSGSLPLEASPARPESPRPSTTSPTASPAPSRTIAPEDFPPATGHARAFIRANLLRAEAAAELRRRVPQGSTLAQPAPPAEPVAGPSTTRIVRPVPRRALSPVVKREEVDVAMVEDTAQDPAVQVPVAQAPILPAIQLPAVQPPTPQLLAAPLPVVQAPVAPAPIAAPPAWPAAAYDGWWLFQGLELPMPNIPPGFTQEPYFAPPAVPTPIALQLRIPFGDLN